MDNSFIYKKMYWTLDNAGSAVSPCCIAPVSV